MKYIKFFILFLFILSSSIGFAQYNYQVIALKGNLQGDLGIDVGTLKKNNIYQGIQGTIPYNNNNRKYYLNGVIGYGNGFVFNSIFIVNGIFGVHVSDTFHTKETAKINLGLGCSFLVKGLVIGCSWTNRESFSSKIGIYLY